MKSLITLVIGIIIFCFGFYLDSLLINYVISVIPKGAEEWLGLIRIGLWVLTFGITFGVSLFFAYMIGGIVYILISK